MKKDGCNMVGNMYKDVVTWNPLAGRCKHECVYCSTHTLRKLYPNCNSKYSGEYRLVEHEMKKSIGKNKTIFVCSQNDLFDFFVPDSMIRKVLERINNTDNVYMLQTKNPYRYFKFLNEINPNTWLGTTIESNIEYPEYSKAPTILERVEAISQIETHKKYVTIEPILDFDLYKFTNLIYDINPDKVYIGADSKKNWLKEPTEQKIKELIKNLKSININVELKENLYRIIKERDLNDGEKDSIKR
jgi:protein gp37